MSSPGRIIDGYLSLLDRQILTSDGRMVGKVDDVELELRDDGRLYVAALLTGPGALGPRFGGALGTLVSGTWSRLAGRTSPGRIDWSHVTEVGSAVELGVSAEAVPVDGLERWVRDRFIAALPGSGVDPE